jgi:hypothetical protein
MFHLQPCVLLLLLYLFQVDPLMAQRMATWVVWGVINYQRKMEDYAAAQRRYGSMHQLNTRFIGRALKPQGCILGGGL